MKVDLFDYELPEELIAPVPTERRDESRLLVLDRRTGALAHRRFFELSDLLQEGDLLVMNDARVMRARLRATRSTGGSVELLLVHPELGESREQLGESREQLGESQEQLDESAEQEGGAWNAKSWLAMVRSSGRLREGEVLRLSGPDARVALRERKGDGYWTVSLEGVAPESILQAGSVPLPPYVLKSRRRRGLPAEMPDLDGERYQTVYASEPGAVAAPTAGLHFTQALLDRIGREGVEVRTLSLLVGPATFLPVRTETVQDHHLGAEFFRLPADTARAVERALREGRRIVATGTTTCRVLEHVARAGRWEQQSGWTDLFIHPPFEFRAVGALITNFHLPRSTLLMLVTAFAGRDEVLTAYQEAVRLGYRFYSYGDAMLIA